jgi:hypothetical protein
MFFGVNFVVLKIILGEKGSPRGDLREIDIKCIHFEFLLEQYFFYKKKYNIIF